MSREFDLLAKQFSKTPASVLRSEYSLYQKDLVREATKFLREVEKGRKEREIRTSSIGCGGNGVRYFEIYNTQGNCYELNIFNKIYTICFCVFNRMFNKFAIYPSEYR